MKNKKTEPKISFARELANRMVDIKDCEIEFNRLSDGSGEYISIIKDEHELCIVFEENGELVTDISLYKQIKQVVDHERVWNV
jgi:hypothetical protein